MCDTDTSSLQMHWNNEDYFNDFSWRSTRVGEKQSIHFNEEIQSTFL